MKAILKNRCHIFILTCLPVVILIGYSNSQTQNIRNSTSPDSINYITFNRKATYCLPYRKNISLLNPKLRKQNTLTFIDNTNDKIWFWNFKKGYLTDSINVKFSRNQRVLNYKIIDSDTLILAFNYFYFGGYHDKILQKTTRKGDFHNYYNFNGAPVRLKEENKVSNKNSFYNPIYFPIVYNPQSKGIVAHIESFTKHKAKQTRNELYWIYPDSQAQKINIKLKFRKPKAKGSYPSTFGLKGAYNEVTNNLVFGASSVSNLIKYNIKKKGHTYHNPKFKSFDTVKTVTKYDSIGKINTQKPIMNKYADIYFDSFNQKYWRLAILGFKSAEMHPLLHNFSIIPIMILDTSLNKIAEGLLPPGHIVNIIPYNGKLLTENTWAEQQENLNYVFSSLSYQINTITKDSFEKILEKRKKASFYTHKLLSKKAYLDSITDQKYSNYWLIPVNRFCSNCLERFSTYLEEHKKALSKKDLAIILMGEEMEDVENYLNKYNLRSLESQNLFIDSAGMFEKAFVPWVNLKHITFNQEAQITREKIYGPGQFKQAD